MGDANCLSREDDAGNSTGGIPIQHYAEVRLTPKLVLSAFSQLGCPVDAGIGGAFTYTVPLRESASLVFGGGAYAAPAQVPLFGGLSTSILRGLQGSDSAVHMAARVDVVWKSQDGHPYNVGVQSFGRGGIRSCSGAVSSPRRTESTRSIRRQEKLETAVVEVCSRRH